MSEKPDHGARDSRRSAGWPGRRRHVLLAVERAAIEPAVDGFDVELRQVEKAEPLGGREPVQAEGGGGVTGANGEGERPRGLVPVGSLEDPGLALEPATVRLVDVLAARCEDVEDEATLGREQLACGSERAELLVLGLHVKE